MRWRQVVTPNLNVSAVLGWCLAYVQNAFGLKWTGDFALDGWNRNKFNHPDRNIPSGIYVPIWFDGYWTGIRYGHVVIYKDGVCYSSPWTAANAALGRHDTLGSIADVERIYRMTYLGWSEDMNGQRVIEQVEEVKVPQETIVDEQLAMKLLELWGRVGEGVTDKSAINSIVSKPIWQAVDTLKASKEGLARQGWINDQAEIEKRLKQARKDAEDVGAIAGLRYKQVDAVLKALGIARQKDEEATVAAAVKMIESLFRPSNEQFEELKQTVYVKKANN